MAAQVAKKTRRFLPQSLHHILSQMNPVHIVTCHFFKIHFNIIFYVFQVVSSLKIFRLKYMHLFPQLVLQIMKLLLMQYLLVTII